MKTCRIRNTAFVFLTFFFQVSLLSQPHYSSELELDKVRLVVNDAASWQIENMPTRGRTPEYNPQYTGWADGTFLGALAYWSEYDSSRNFVEWYENLAEELRWEVGHRSFNPANDIAVALMYAKIWERNPLPRYLDVSKATDRVEFLELLAGGWDPLIPTIERLDYQIKTYPDEALLEQHPHAKSETWSWPDALYMAAPVYSIFANITGDTVYREFMDREFWATVTALCDEEEKLFHQEEGTKKLREPNGEKMFWGRGNGWVIGALSLVIDLLPEDHSSLPRYQSLFREMMQRVTSLQQESGYWHSSMLDPESYPDPETSATGFFAFGLWWGINNGLLCKEDYLDPAVKAWEALVRAVHPNGMLGHVQAIGGRPALKIPADSYEVYGTGAFMLTGLEICKYLESSAIFQVTDPDRPAAWCWFQDKRVVIDQSDPSFPILLTGGVTYGDAGSDARGDIDLYWIQLQPDSINPVRDQGRFELDDQLQMDDHASPSFLIRPDGRYLVNWSEHGSDRFIRTRISVEPGNPGMWTEINMSDAPRVGITYTNPLFLSSENEGKGLILNGIRSLGHDSNFLISRDLGETWKFGGRVIDSKDPWPHSGEGGRAYVKYASDGKSKVHLFATDDHPVVNFNEERTDSGRFLNSLYHGYIEDGKLHRSNGEVIDDNIFDEEAVPPTELTILLKDSTVINGDAMRRGWVTDVETDREGNPLGIIQFRANDEPSDHRYFYARYLKNQWHVNFMAHAGGFIGDSSQLDYTGLASVDPSNPGIVFISTNVNPVTGDPLISKATNKTQFEIFMGRTGDYGRSWIWVPLTQNSKTDNIRPIVPEWTEGKSVVLWLKGNYYRYTEYDTHIVGQIIYH